MTTSEKARMLRCVSSFVIAAYVTVRLIPQDSRALPEPAPAKAGGLFAKPSIVETSKTFYEDMGT